MATGCIVAGSVTEPGGCVTPPAIPAKVTPYVTVVPTHAAPPAPLAYTGADFGLLLCVGLAALGTGFILRLGRRAR